MEIVTKVMENMEKSWKFVGKNVYEPWFKQANELGRLFNNSNNKCCVDALKCGDRSL